MSEKWRRWRAFRRLGRPGSDRATIHVQGVPLLIEDGYHSGVWIGDGDGHAIFQLDDGRVMEWSNPLWRDDEDTRDA